jgi:hypothetical protein
MAVPPVATVYQLIVLPAEVAFKLELDPEQKLEGVAVTEVGAATPTVATALPCVPQHPSLYAAK